MVDGGAFFDYDNDGDLDLYVTNFGHWKLPEDDRSCGGPKAPGQPGPEYVHIYCNPRSVRPARHILYRNNGDGTFTDATEAAGVARDDGRGLGVVAADLSGDGRVDLYVTNDTCPNFLYLNRGDGTFEDVTDTSGAGYDPAGNVRAGMGVNAEDVNGDGLPDLFVTNYSTSPTRCTSAWEAGASRSRRAPPGMMHDSLPWVGWGCTLADFDNDGWPDCFVVNGHIDDNLHLFDRRTPTRSPPCCIATAAAAGSSLATREAGAYFDADHVGAGRRLRRPRRRRRHRPGRQPPGRAGRPCCGTTRRPHRWIRLGLEGTRSNRDGIGATVEIVAGGRTIVRQRKAGRQLRRARPTATGRAGRGTLGADRQGAMALRSRQRLRGHPGRERPVDPSGPMCPGPSGADHHRQPRRATPRGRDSPGLLSDHPGR